MKIKTVFLFLILISTSLLGQDLSSPIDGNLFVDFKGAFYPNQSDIYNDSQILESANLEFVENRILFKDRIDTQVDVDNMNWGSDAAWFGDNSYVVLTGNSNRYAHGILGDTNEPTGFAVFVDNELVSTYELPSNYVFETLRPLITDIIPENPGEEIVLTSSNSIFGARVEIYSLQAELLGVSDAIGRGFRWLHVIGAAPLKGTPREYLAIVKTPHINGVLELLFWNGERLEPEFSFSGVSSHLIGSSNLNMALLMNIDLSKDIEIILPSFNYRKLLFLKIENDSIVVKNEFDLPGRIATNILFDSKDDPSIWIGFTNNKILRISQ